MGNEVREKVLKCIAEQVGLELSDFTEPPEKFTDASRLTEDIGFDSLDGIELELSLETEFKRSVSDAEAAKWRTVGDVVRFWEKAGFRIQ